MTRTEYEMKRKKLLTEARALLDSGDIAGHTAKVAEVETLDEEFDTMGAAVANLAALEGNAPARSMPGVNPAESTAAGSEEIDLSAGGETYMNAWAKTLMGRQLTADETRSFEMVNEYTHTTSNTSILVPETVASGIWEEIADEYPYWNDVSKTYVNGTLTMVKEDTSSDAAWYDEDTETEDGTETFTSYTLTGCELARNITVSWKLREMAIEDFIPYVTRRLARKMGEALGYGVVQGQGQPGSDDTFKPEPLGIVTALKADGSQVNTVTTLDYDALITTRALVKSGYGAELNVYANSATIWTGLASIVDGNGRPIFYIDPANSQGVGKVLGCTVKEDASLNDDEILFSNPSRGYSANINKDISIGYEDHVTLRTTDYAAYAIVDGAPITLKAHALLIVEESA